MGLRVEYSLEDASIPQYSVPNKPPVTSNVGPEVLPLIIPTGISSFIDKSSRILMYPNSFVLGEVFAGLP